MGYAENLEKLTGTFSKDKEFCERLFASDNVEAAARLIVLYQWSNSYLPHFQQALSIRVIPYFANASNRGH